MKRTLCLIVLFLLLLTASVHAADTRTVRVEALDLSIDVPAKCYALTPDMDPFRFSTVGFHQHIYTFDEVMAMQDQMKEMGAALRVWATDPAFICLLEASPIQMQSMDLLDDAALDEMLAQGIPELTNEFMTITGSSLFRTEHTVFIRYEAQAEYDGVQEQIIIYGTVHDYQMLGLTVGYAGELMPEKYRTIADEMAASLRFGEDAEPAAAAAEEGKTQAAEPTENTAEEAEAESDEPEAEPKEEAGAEAAAEPAADAPAGTLDAGQPVSPIGNPDLSFRIGYIVGCATRAVLVIAGIVVCVILLRKNKKNKNTRRQDGAAPAAPTNPAVPAKRVCAACGADLGPDEKFCPFCGTKAE